MEDDVKKITSIDEINSIARSQFRLDTNCSAACEQKYRIMINRRRDMDGARFYEGVSTFFRAILYRGDAYIMADSDIYGWAREHYERAKPEWFCRYDRLRLLDQKLMEFGYRIMDTHVYFLPSVLEFKKRTEMLDRLHSMGYTVKWFDRDQIESMRGWGIFPHALVYSKSQPDVIAVGAFFEGGAAAMAGASQDGRYLWQIGVDVTEQHEGQGLATLLVNLLKLQICSLGKVPFYGTSESHAVSMTVAVKAGFLPAWSEIFVEKVR